MKKILSVYLSGFIIFGCFGLAMAEPVLEKTLISPDKVDLRDNLTIINPDETVDPDAEQPEEFYHYGPPSPEEIEFLRDPYVFEPYMNLLPDPAKIMLLKKMEQDKQLSPSDLEEIPIEIREQALEQVMKERHEAEMEAEREAQMAAQEEMPPEDVAQDGGLSRIEHLFSEYWVEFLALIVSVVGLILGVTGFSMAASKKKKSISQLMNEIDDTFDSFKWKSKRCEAELYRLHDIVDEKLKNGKLDESSYQVLVNRIDKYLSEINELGGQGPQEG